MLLIVSSLKVPVLEQFVITCWKCPGSNLLLIVICINRFLVFQTEHSGLETELFSIFISEVWGLPIQLPEKANFYHCVIIVN
jgi:hypothetical protein